MATDVLHAGPGVPLTPPRVSRIVIATEYALLGDGLRSLLESQSRSCLVLHARTIPQSLRAAALQADLLLLDGSLSTLIAPSELRDLAAAVPVVILAHASGPIAQRMAHALGVRDVIDKDARATELLAVVRSLLPVDRWSDVDASDESEQLEPRSAQVASVFRLTQRERQVLELVAEACANKQIAERLDITEDTVKRHLTSVFYKIGVSNRVELALFATEYASLPADSLPRRGTSLLARPAGSARYRLLTPNRQHSPRSSSRFRGA